MKYHYTYRTTNKLTGEYYLGLHSTINKNDGYMGSGRKLKESLRRYGKNNHIIEILEFYNDRSSLKDVEINLIKENLSDPLCLNIRAGGAGMGNKFTEFKTKKCKTKNCDNFIVEHRKYCSNKCKINEKKEIIMKNNQYVPTTLDGYLNESKSFMLKRGYGSRKPVIVGAKGGVRDQVLPFVAENRRVSGKVLRKFITGLNEQGSKPAAVNMWIKRNSKYFVAESRNGTTFYTLSKIGKRLVNRMKPILEQKGDHDFIDKKKGYDRPGITSSANEDDEMTDEACDEALVAEADTAGAEIKTGAIEKYLAGKKKRMHKKSEWANLLEAEEEEEVEEETVEEMAEPDEDAEKLEESNARKGRIEKLLEEIKDKRETEKLNEEDEEDEDELTFDDIDLGDDEEEEGEEADAEEGEEAEGDGDVDNIEIAEFILTVDDADAAIAELEERGITADIVTDLDTKEADDLDLEDDEEGEEGEEGGDEDLFGDAEEGEESEEAEDTDFDLGLEEADDTDEEVDDSGFDLGGDEEDTIEGEDEEEVEDIDLGDEDVIAGEEGEEDEGQKIRVSAEHAEELVKYLEEKGVDVEEMFGGELDIEGGDEDEEGEEGEEPAQDVEDAEDVDSEEDAGGEEDEELEL